MNEDSSSSTLSSSLPFEQGDRLSRDEFERQCESMSMMYRAELIEGIVSISPLPQAKCYSRHHARIVTWLGFYEAEMIGFEFRNQVSVRLNLNTVVHPNVIFTFKPELAQPALNSQALNSQALNSQALNSQALNSQALNSQAPIANIQAADSNYFDGVPELIVEIVEGWSAIDLTDRKAVYGKNGVREYLVWRSLDEEIDWFYWEHGIYIELLMDTDGLIHSRTFPGLWLDRDALLAGDMQAVLTSLHLGLQSCSEHPNP